MAIHLPGNNHYFHQVDDKSQTTTAQRATFRPSLSNKIANRFLQSENPKVQKFGNVFKNLRAADLNTRATIRNGVTATYKTGVNLRAKMDKDYASTRRDQNLAAADERNDTMQTRYEYKQNINAAAGKDMQQEIESSNDKLQSRLGKKGYVASGGLAAQKIAGENPVHFSNNEFHRFSASYSKLPAFAKSISQGVSARHDAGISGVRRAVVRGAEYGAVGIANTVQLGKQGLFAAAKKLAPEQSEEEGTFERHANKARDMRHLNSAALRGNGELAQQFRTINQERLQSIEDQADRMGYGIAPDHPDSGGVASPRTHYFARKFNNYFGQRNPALAGADSDRAAVTAMSEKTGEVVADAGTPVAPAMEKRKKLARAFVSLTTFPGNQRLKRYEAGYAKWSGKIANGDTSDNAAQKLQHYDAKRFNARFKIDTMVAAVDGRMHERIDEFLPPPAGTGRADSETGRDEDDASSLNGSLAHDKLFDMSQYQEDARSVDSNGLRPAPEDRRFRSPPSASSGAEDTGSSYERDMAALGVRLGEQFSSPTFGATRNGNRDDDEVSDFSVAETGEHGRAHSDVGDFVSAVDHEEDHTTTDDVPQRHDGLGGEFGNRSNGGVNRT